jgi:hypothetical protein
MGLGGNEMFAVVFAIFSACCTLIAAISVIFFGVSVSFIVKMYFLYLMLSAVAVPTIPGAVFLFNLLQKWTRGSIADGQDSAPSAGKQISSSMQPAPSTLAFTGSLNDRPTRG